MWRGFDVELDEYCRVAERPLLELPVDFPPTYPRQEEDPGSSGARGEGGATAQGGPAAAASFGYEGKRCPSWCGLGKLHSVSSAAQLVRPWQVIATFVSSVRPQYSALPSLVRPTSQQTPDPLPTPYSLLPLSPYPYPLSINPHLQSFALTLISTPTPPSPPSP